MNEGQLLAGTTTGTSTTVNAQPVSLYALNVPNALGSGVDASKNLDVAAVDVLGHVLLPGR